MQPEFGASFHTSSTGLIAYEVRSLSPDELHDAVYLSSYIHDATFRLDEITRHRGNWILHLERDRWELYQAGNELLAVSSELTISPVKDFRLEFTEPWTLEASFLREPQVTVRTLRIIQDAWDKSDDREVVIDCCHSAIRLKLRVPEDFRLSLRDLP